MTWRHGAYVISAIAAGGLLLELGWAIEDRIRLHLVDRGVRALEQLREVARI